MEINLELPSHEQQLDSGSNINVDNTDSMDDVVVQDADVDFPAGIDNVNEFFESNTNESVACCGEQIAGADAVSEGDVSEPRNGLEFESKEAAYYFYREYARSVGFGITIKASRRSKKSGKFIDVKIACSRFGSKRESSTTVNPRSCPKTGCKAGLHMKRREDEKWVIYNFVEEHNHEICPDDFYIGIRGKNQQVGAIAHQKKGLQLALDEEDMKVMLEHFMSMQDQNPGFFYAIELDGERQLRNVFWVDGKARQDYGNFSDVVLFDTFYVRNKYKIPFAPFVGVDHHCQYILLGCALIGEESASSFSWLMRTWLKAMGGQAPKVIITDQDKFLSEAVAETYPDTRQCFCLWNVLSKIPEKLNCVMDRNEQFMKKFRKCIHQCWSDEQFERRWSKMVGKFELSENEWVRSLFKDRKKWVPHYLQGTCLVGLSAAERPGSIASYFDKYMHREATLQEFIVQYMTSQQDRYDIEAKADLETQSKQPELRSLSAFENQLSVIYTDTAFKKFQAEVLGVVSCQLQIESEDETTIFLVEDFEQRQNFLVAWNEAELDVCCSCHSFLYRGFLCKHAILVLQNCGISDIPSKYILKHWSKDGNLKESKSEKSSRLHYRVERFNDLCRRAIKLGQLGSFSEEAYNITLKVLEETLKQCVGVNNSVKSLSEANKLGTYGFIGIGNEDQRNSMAKSSKRKKMHKKRKVYSGSEGGANRSQDSYQDMEQVSPIAHNLDNCYIPQRDVGELELGSRAANLDIYYGSQQTIQGIGQTSISPIREEYYGSQPAMQVMGNLHSARGQISNYESHQSMHEVVQGQVGFRSAAVRGCFDIEGTLQDMSMESSQFQSSAPRHLSDKHLTR